jgi:hemolysin III
MDTLDRPARKQFRIKDPFCGVSHGIGAVLSVVALITLLVVAAGRMWQTISFAVYGATLIILYSASCLYHSLMVEDHHAERLKRLDHVGIFLLIAGTYTPVCLVSLHGPWGWSMLTAEWVMAGLGIAGIVLLKKMPAVLRVILYLGMGWLAVIALAPLRAALPPAAMSWLFAGGITYSVGVIFYATEWPHCWPGRFDGHDLWHLFVMAGSACHYVLMLLFIAR